MGRTLMCPSCGGAIYVPLPNASRAVSHSLRAPTGELSDTVAAFQKPDSPAIEPDAELPRPQTSVRLAAVGWLLLVLGVSLKFVSTPTIVLLAWCAVVGAVTCGIVVSLRSLRWGVPLLVLAIALPALQSWWFWRQIGLKVELEAQRMQARVEEFRRQAATVQMPVPTIRTDVVHQSPVTPDWRRASEQARLTGSVVQEGKRSAVVSGKLYAEGETVRALVGPYEYMWRVTFRGDTPELVPMAARRP